MKIWHKIKIYQIQDGGQTPHWKPFLAIYRRHILRFMQISEWRWRITCRYRTVDQNGNFHKFKMANGRHFENSFIFISQSELSDFDQIWYADANFHSEDGYLTKIEIFQIQDGGRDIENRFGYIRRLIGRLTWNWNGDDESHADIGHVTKNGNFPKSKMADGRHFENSFRCLHHSDNEIMLSSVFQ